MTAFTYFSASGDGTRQKLSVGVREAEWQSWSKVKNHLVVGMGTIFNTGRSPVSLIHPGPFQRVCPISLSLHLFVLLLSFFFFFIFFFLFLLNQHALNAHHFLSFPSVQTQGGGHFFLQDSQLYLSILCLCVTGGSVPLFDSFKLCCLCTNVQTFVLFMQPIHFNHIAISAGCCITSGVYLSK